MASTAERQLAELTVGYRTPAAILDLANRLLPEAAPGVSPARSIRRSDAVPTVEHVTEPAQAAADRAADAVPGRGTVAVIAVRARHAAIGARLAALGVDWGSEVVGSGSVAVLDPLLAKGLEFDVVVVVEPAEIVAAEPAGHRALFVALTRPTQRLVIVHDEPLPDLLAY